MPVVRTLTTQNHAVISGTLDTAGPPGAQGPAAGSTEVATAPVATPPGAGRSQGRSFAPLLGGPGGLGVRGGPGGLGPINGRSVVGGAGRLGLSAAAPPEPFHCPGNDGDHNQNDSDDVDVPGYDLVMAQPSTQQGDGGRPRQSTNDVPEREGLVVVAHHACAERSVGPDDRREAGQHQGRTAVPPEEVLGLVQVRGLQDFGVIL